MRFVRQAEKVFVSAQCQPEMKSFADYQIRLVVESPPPIGNAIAGVKRTIFQNAPVLPEKVLWQLASTLPVNLFYFIGASLSEPHSYVLTWTFVIRDIIHIYKSSVRPLGFVPETIEPKSRANPVLRLCLPLALIDNDFLSKGCRFKSLVLYCQALFFVSLPTASGVPMSFETNSI